MATLHSGFSFACLMATFFQQNSKNRIRGTDAVFSKGIFMKKFLRKDTYIIRMQAPFVKPFLKKVEVLQNILYLYKIRLIVSV